jgi:hypothetical protein
MPKRFFLLESVNMQEPNPLLEILSKQKLLNFGEINKFAKTDTFA